MVIPRSRLAFVYGLVAFLALLATWNQNLHYFGGDAAGGGSPLVAFWKDTFANPAAASITLDIGLFVLAAAIWMVLEARRLGMPYVWLYIVGGFLIAISVTFPLFMLMRERRLATLGQVQPAITGADAIGLLLVAVPAVVLSVWSLFA
jgi:hypothetical protein